MSNETRPISPASFARAIEDLPVENLYAKALEIDNSVSHLEQSNKALQEYSDSIKEDQSLDPATRAHGDTDCLDAIKENMIVIERQHERVRLLKAEVERRGQAWHEKEPEPEPGSATNGRSIINEHNSNGSTESTIDTAAPRRLTDEELQRQLAARLPDNEEDDEGMQL